MRKQISVLAAAGILSAAVMTGCSSKPAETTAAAAAETTAAETTAEETTAQESKEEAEGQKESAAAETEKEAEAVSQTEPLVVYLNDFDAIIPDLFKEATGYDVEVVVGNGAETMARIETEGDNPQWDVVWLDSMPSIYSMGQKGMLLTEWEPSNAANLTDCTGGQGILSDRSPRGGCYRVPERCVHRGNGAQNMGRFRQGRI